MESSSLTTDHMTLRKTLAGAWGFAKPYFGSSPEKTKAWWLLAGVIGTALADISLAYGMNAWQKELWNCFEAMNTHSFAMVMGEFVGRVGLSSATSAIA